MPISELMTNHNGKIFYLSSFIKNNNLSQEIYNAKLFDVSHILVKLELREILVIPVRFNYETNRIHTLLLHSGKVSKLKTHRTQFYSIVTLFTAGWWYSALELRI